MSIVNWKGTLVYMFTASKDINLDPTGNVRDLRFWTRVAELGTVYFGMKFEASLNHNDRNFANLKEGCV